MSRKGQEKVDAKGSGGRRGRPPLLSDEQVKLLMDERASGVPVFDIAVRLGVSVATIYRVTSDYDRPPLSLRKRNAAFLAKLRGGFSNSTIAGVLGCSRRTADRLMADAASVLVAKAHVAFMASRDLRQAACSMTKDLGVRVKPSDVRKLREVPDCRLPARLEREVNRD